MQLLVDVGNTFIHFAVYSENSLQTTFKISSRKTKSLIMQNIIKQLHGFDYLIKHCIISSVNPKINPIIINISKRYKWKFLIVKDTLKSNISYNIDNSSELGADLIAAAVGARNKYPKRDLIIVILGTATTISCVKHHQYIGGAILAGLHITEEILSKRTALLKDIVLQQLPKDLIAKNTNDAISVGLIYGHMFAIQGIIKEYQQKLSNPVVIISGGNYKFMQPFLKDYILEEHLIFDGLNILWALNKE